MHEGTPELFHGPHIPTLAPESLVSCPGSGEAEGARVPHSPSLSLVSDHRAENMGGAGRGEGQESWPLSEQWGIHHPERSLDT